MVYFRDRKINKEEVDKSEEIISVPGAWLEQWGEQELW
jgi:hypothetical protein